MESEPFTMRSLFATPEGEELYQAIQTVYRETGGRGEPPERLVVYYFTLVYPTAEATWRDEGLPTPALIHQALSGVMDEFLDLARLAHAYIDHRDSDVYHHLLSRCWQYLSLATFGQETLQMLKEAS